MGIHVVNLAKGLASLEVRAVIATPDALYSEEITRAGFVEVPFSQIGDYKFPNNETADLVHAWTPRQHVIRVTMDACRSHGCPYFVHLEDDEDEVTALLTGSTVEELRRRLEVHNMSPIPDTLMHPSTMGPFMAGARGVTVIIDRLFDFKPQNIPGLEIWPAAEDDIFYPQQADQSLRAKIGAWPSTKVITYNGNVHNANVAEVRSLYLAVELLARSGMDVILIRLGSDFMDILPEGIPPTRIVNVPFQSRRDVARHLGIADYLI